MSDSSLIKTAATQRWTSSKALSVEQKKLPVVTAWKYIELLPDGSMKAVNILTGERGALTEAAVILQELRIGDVSEVREGVTRSEDVVVHYSGDYPG
jgi:hypothetical protein